MKGQTFDESIYEFFPYELIVRAVNEDEEALTAAVNHFTAYAHRKLDDALAEYHVNISDQQRRDLLDEMRTHYIMAVLKFSCSKYQ